MERPNSKGSHNFVVGLFVLVSMLVSVGFIVFMGSSVFSNEFQIKAMFKDVRGLNIGAPVFISGIQVGRVSNKAFPTGERLSGFEGEAANKIMVVLTVYTENKDRVKVDSRATITTMGVLGDKVVVVSPGSSDAATVVPDAWIGTEEPKEISDYVAEGSDLVSNLSKAAAQLNFLLESMNRDGKMSSLVENLDSSAKSLSKVLETLRKGDSSLGSMIVGGDKDKLAKSLARLDKILEKVEKGQGTLGALIHDSTLHEDMKVLLGGAKRSGTLRFLIRQAIKEGEDKEKQAP
jgi:phospholipid/cholesterol/gamma-HCH transport system substrate-binding protein